MIIEPLLSEVALRRRSIGVFLLVAVFFLPFHFHAATTLTSQLSNECTCLHGTRTVIGITAAVALAALPLLVALPESFEPQLVSRSVTGFQAIRAPPVL
jgi:hypothetical protein